MSQAEQAKPAARRDAVEDILLNHEYDGIQEYDNPLPGWWKNVFWATFFFSIGYIIYYHLGGGGLSMHQEYNNELAVWNYNKAVQDAKFAAMPLKKRFEKALTKKQDMIEKGRVLYNSGKAQCATCHGKKAQGVIGPNLTDNFWINGPKSKRKEGPTLRDIYRVISEGGRPGKGMAPWKDALKPNERIQLTLYVASLRGSKPAKGKKVSVDAVKYSYIKSKWIP